MKDHLFEKVAWCVVDDSKVRSNLSLLDWLRNVQFYAKRKEANYFFPHGDKLFLIEEKYWLRETEFDCAKQILKAYQKDLIQKYFTNHLIEYSFTRKLTEAEYFLCTLNEFLEDHECEKTFDGNQMYNTKKYKDLGCWGTPLFEATYELTDFAVVYHKMYFIAQTYCLTLRKNPLDTDTTSYQNAEATRKVLDTREIEVSRF